MEESAYMVSQAYLKTEPFCQGVPCRDKILSGPQSSTNQSYWLRVYWRRDPGVWGPSVLEGTKMAEPHARHTVFPLVAIVSKEPSEWPIKVDKFIFKKQFWNLFLLYLLIVKLSLSVFAGQAAIN